MHITPDDLKAFLAIEEHKSFIAAAEELCVTPPALTRRIKKLEAIVGEKLFERTTHMVVLTSTGRTLLERARLTAREFQSFHHFAETFAHNHGVAISFASVMSVAAQIIPGLIRDYSALHPGARFVVHDSNGLDVIRMVEERGVDFGISTRPQPEKELAFVPLCKDPFILACPPQHPLYGASSVSWEQLADGNAMLLEGASSAFGFIRARLREARIPMPAGVRVRHLSTQIGFLESGVNAVVLPALGVSLCRTGEVKVFHIRKPRITRELGLVTRRDGCLNKSAQSFMAFINREFPGDTARCSTT